MIITRETDYAIRILRSLADLQLKNIREISDEQMIPRQFAYKISKKLERAGFIEIIRGAQGGYAALSVVGGQNVPDRGGGAGAVGQRHGGGGIGLIGQFDAVRFRF